MFLLFIFFLLFSIVLFLFFLFYPLSTYRKVLHKYNLFIFMIITIIIINQKSTQRVQALFPNDEESFKDFLYKPMHSSCYWCLFLAGNNLGVRTEIFINSCCAGMLYGLLEYWIEKHLDCVASERTLHLSQQLIKTFPPEACGWAVWNLPCCWRHHRGTMLLNCRI